MTELKPLSICNLDTAIAFYRDMIEEYRHRDPRLANVDTDDKSLRNMLQYSFDIENDLFLILYIHGKAVGFIDSARVAQDGGEESWFIKSVYLVPEYRETRNFELLVGTVEREVRKRGIRTVFSTALIEDDRANSLWESAGFTIEPKRRVKTS